MNYWWQPANWPHEISIGVNGNCISPANRIGKFVLNYHPIPVCLKKKSSNKQWVGATQPGATLAKRCILSPAALPVTLQGCDAAI